MSLISSSTGRMSQHVPGLFPFSNLLRYLISEKDLCTCTVRTERESEERKAYIR